MNDYRNLTRPGVRSTTTAEPRDAFEDIDLTIRELSPNAVPLQMFGQMIGYKSPPKSNVISVMQDYQTDNFDYCSSVTLGSGNDDRFARLTLDQPSRPEVSNILLYAPQDKFFIVATGQVVEVVMTPRAAIEVDEGTELTIADTALTGNSTSRTAAGTLLVRNIDDTALLTFTASDVIYLGRTIYESQDIMAESWQRDYVYDRNFVEHKEKVFIMTEDQAKLIRQKSGVPDLTRQQKAMMREFKMEVEHNAMFSERQMDFTVGGRPKGHMRGLFHAIRTNVSYYNPTTLDDFEQMFTNFAYEQAFRYFAGDIRQKMGVCGGRFLINFNLAFRDTRRVMSLTTPKEVKFDTSTFILPGEHAVTFARSETLRMGTPLENWCFVIDPSAMKWRIAKDYTSREYSNRNERDFKVMVEWQGTIAWEFEQVHALLRTY